MIIERYSNTDNDIDIPLLRTFVNAMRQSMIDNDIIKIFHKNSKSLKIRSKIKIKNEKMRNMIEI